MTWINEPKNMETIDTKGFCDTFCKPFCRTFCLVQGF